MTLISLPRMMRAVYDPMRITVKHYPSRVFATQSLPGISLVLLVLFLREELPLIRLPVHQALASFSLF